jgi:hypothetical protein
MRHGDRDWWYGTRGPLTAALVRHWTRAGGISPTHTEATVRLEDLLGRHVRYKGDEGYVIEGHADVQASVVVSIPATSGAPSRSVTVPESEWDELELLR